MLARWGSWTLVNFGLFAALGSALAAWVVTARLTQVGLPARSLLPTLGWAVPVAMWVGSRFYALVLLELPDLWRDPWGTLSRTTLAWQGGFVAVTGVVLALAWWWDLDLLTVIDSFAFAVPVGQALGRVGCWTYGCCHGRPTTSRWSIVVHDRLSKTAWFAGLADTPLHPTQAYDAALNGLVAVGLAALAATGPLPAGTVAATYLVVDGVKRFGLERLRWCPVVGPFGLTPFQVFAGLQALVGAVLAATTRGTAPVDFATGLGPALREAASGWPWFLLVGLLVFATMGVHRGDPGRITLRPVKPGGVSFHSRGVENDTP